MEAKTVIDWSKAPEGATHYAVRLGSYMEGWYKVKERGYYFIPVSEETELWNGSDNNGSPSERINLIPKPELTYTQAMCDAGELPSVGMECNFKKRGAVEKGTVTAITKRFIIFTDTFGDEHVRKIDECTIEPLTPPIELIDGKAYQFDIIEGVDDWAGIYCTQRNQMCTSHSYFDIKHCTNIQLLEVTK